MTLPNLSQAGKVVVVTGGRRGIGKAIALLFAEAGADITVTDVMADDEFDATAAEIRALGRRCLAIQGDTTRKADVDNVFQETIHELGGVDVLINSAGISTRITPMEISEAEWDRVMDINLKGCLFCAQAAGRRMVEQGRGGTIINLSSVAGIKAVTVRAGYGTSKIGLIMLTKQLALELAPHKIRVNAIAPGLVRTQLTRDAWGEAESEKQMSAMVPMGRWAEASEIADAALFLASDAAAYISGITLPVDGALSIV